MPDAQPSPFGSVFSRPSQPGLEKDYEPAFQAWQKTPTPQTSAQLLKAVQPVLDTAISSYAPGIATANGRAKLMALEAFKTYDPQRGSLKTHLISQLQGLRRYAGQAGNAIRIPERVGIMRSRIQDATNELSLELGRDPGDDELAERLAISVPKLRLYRRAGEMPEGALVDPETGEPSFAAVEGLSGRDPAHEAYLDLVREGLSPLDRSVMDWRLGRYGGRPLSGTEIAAKLRVTPSAVSQRLARIQQLIDEEPTVSPFR